MVKQKELSLKEIISSTLVIAMSIGFLGAAAIFFIEGSIHRKLSLILLSLLLMMGFTFLSYLGLKLCEVENE